jgi:hypothetical protein
MNHLDYLLRVNCSSSFLEWFKYSLFIGRSTLRLLTMGNNTFSRSVVRKNKVSSVTKKDLVVHLHLV